MPSLQSLPWIDPIAFAMNIMENESVNLSHLVFLHSSVRTSYSGRYSYLAFNPVEVISASSFEALKEQMHTSNAPVRSMWFGYLGYGLKDSLETLAHDTPNWYSLPALTMTRFANVIRFDNDLKTIDVLCGKYPHMVYDNISHNPPTDDVSVLHLSSNMTKADYLAKVDDIIERILNGDLYQANLTRKFTGKFNKPVNPLALFSKLCQVSPAAYSAFVKIGETYLLSSSPELFLAIDTDSTIRTRPIKGTSARFSEPLADQKSRDALASSAKDRAENLMIVDLMRNDLSRSCDIGSVVTQKLFEITSHATVHHMSSTITGRIRENLSTIDAIAHCFPPGSMTGAPKIRAMNVCSELENIERGVYSGAIGWLANDGSCELSVVIRTLIMEGDQFEFQVGGGITADSTPEGEWLETLDKAKGILLSLGLTSADLQF